MLAFMYSTCKESIYLPASNPYSSLSINIFIMTPFTFFKPVFLPSLWPDLHRAVTRAASAGHPPAIGPRLLRQRPAIGHPAGPRPVNGGPRYRSDRTQTNHLGTD